jgi:hypothetical protein
VASLFDRLLRKFIPISADADLPATTTEEYAAAAIAADAAQEVRARCLHIMESAEAQGRERLARHLALGTDLAATEAIAILTATLRESIAAPMSDKEARQQHLNAAFEAAFNRAEFDIPERGEATETIVQRIKRNFDLAAGIKAAS